MAGDIEAIEKVVWTYLDGLYEGDTGKLGKAFHEVSHLYSMHEGGVADLPRANWFDLVNSRPSAKSRGLPRTDRIVSIDLSGPETAFVKLECSLPPALLHRLPDAAQAEGRLAHRLQDLPHRHARVARGLRSGARSTSFSLGGAATSPRPAAKHQCAGTDRGCLMDLLEAAGRALRSPAFKFVLILFLIVLLLIPLALVYALIGERENRAASVRREVGQLWGPEQRMLGPFLVVPYTVRVETVQGDKRFEQILERRAVFTPEVLDVAGRADAKTLRRSIFEVPVYAARLKLSGRFGAPRIADVAAEVVAVRWRDAAFVLGLTGVSGLKEAATLKIAGATDIPFAPSIGFPGTQLTGIHAKLAGAGAGAAARSRAAAAAVRLHRRPCLQRLRLAHRGAGCARDARIARLRLAASELRRRVPARRAPGDRRRLHGSLEDAAPGAQRARGLGPRGRTAWSGCSRMRSA